MNIDPNQFQNRQFVQVNQQQANFLIKKKQLFQKAIIKMQSDFDSSKDQIYYIVSSKFIKQWIQFCQSSQNKRYAPNQMNQDIYQNNQLKKELVQKQNYQIVNEQIYQIFAPYIDRSNINKRQAVIVGRQKKITIYLKQYHYVFIDYPVCTSIDRKYIFFKDFPLKTIKISGDAILNQLGKNILHQNIQKSLIDQDTEFRLWTSNKQLTHQGLYNLIKKQLGPCQYDKYKIRGAGRLIQDLNFKLGQLMLDQQAFFIFQLKSQNRNWVLLSDQDDKCQGCYTYAKLSVICGCKKSKYCSQACLEKDQYFHKRQCTYAEQMQLNRPVQMIVQPKSRHGLVGLNNLGNTCFMNSCLQCLSNTIPLTNYFLNKHFQFQINKINPIGTKGKIAKNYAKFIKGTWCDQDEKYSPYSVKNAVGQKNPMFSDFSQHDSQQFFSSLVDGLHQDLNRIYQKPNVPSVEDNNRSDLQVARQSWVAHIKRNQSIITDLMTGQYRSIVTCPDCTHKSTTFDPFITVTLPIPENIQMVTDFFFIHANMQRKNKRGWFKYNNKNADEWNQKANEVMGSDINRCFLYVTSLKQDIYRVGRQSMAQIAHKIENQNKNLFLVQFTQEQMLISKQNLIQFTTRISKDSYYNVSQQLFFKIPFIFNKNGLTGLTIYKRFFKFLYGQAYNDNKSKKTLGWGGKNYQQYQQQILKDRPLKVFLRLNKKPQQHLTRKQVQFKKQIELQDDTDICELLKKQQCLPSECQLDARFQRSKISEFNFSKLKDFDTVGKEPKVAQKQDIQVQLDGCLVNFATPQILQAGNEWYCPKCKQHKLAKKQLSIYRAPKILIFHLKRFKQKNAFRKQKNNSLVRFPQQLDLSSYLIDKKPIQAYKTQIQQNIYQRPKDQKLPLINFDVNSKPLYSLYAISNHFGGLGGGHYTAYAKNNNEWYQFDDSRVSAASKKQMVSSGAYLLFYERKQ